MRGRWLAAGATSVAAVAVAAFLVLGDGNGARPAAAGDALDTALAREPAAALPPMPDPRLKPGELWYTGAGVRLLLPRPDDRPASTEADVVRLLRKERPSSFADGGPYTVVLARYSSFTYPEGDPRAAGRRAAPKERLVWAVTFPEAWAHVHGGINRPKDIKPFRCPMVHIVDAVSMKGMGAFQSCQPPLFG